MKKVFLSALLLTGFAAAGFAQERGDRERRMERAQRNPEEMVQKRVDTLASRLNLSEEQKEQVYDLNLNRVKARQAWRDEYNDELRSRLQEYRKTREADEAKMKEILTEEQYAQYQELRKEESEKMRMHHRRPRRPGERIPREEFHKQKPDTGKAGEQ